MKIVQHRPMTVGYDQEAPRDCPFPPSRDLKGIQWTGGAAAYTKADTWYPSWSKSGVLYSPFTDGEVNGVGVSSSAAASASQGRTEGFGVARLLGDDPLDLQVETVALVEAPAAPWGGRYPSANLYLDGVWYVGTYCVNDRNRGHNYWDHLGPFTGFHVSRDDGASWTEPPTSPSRPLFDEGGPTGGFVRFGAPHFVDLGQELEHSPDGYAYLVGHGDGSGPNPASWVSGDAVYLARVRPTPDGINDPASWEFYAGGGLQCSPRWSRSLQDCEPIVSWPGHLGNVSITYLPAHQRFVMCVTDGWPTIKKMDSYILEASTLEGPWRLVAHLEEFGPQGYFLNIPSKFATADGRAWLVFSANYTNHLLGSGFEPDPTIARYAMCLAQFEFLTA